MLSILVRWKCWSLSICCVVLHFLIFSPFQFLCSLYPLVSVHAYILDIIIEKNFQLNSLFGLVSLLFYFYASFHTYVCAWDVTEFRFIAFFLLSSENFTNFFCFLEEHFNVRVKNLIFSDFRIFWFPFLICIRGAPEIFDFGDRNEAQ